MLGAYAFLWFHYIIALGISLSASHLSDLTLTIIAAMHCHIGRQRPRWVGKRFESYDPF